MRHCRYKQDEQLPNVAPPSSPLSGKVAKTCASDQGGYLIPCASSKGQIIIKATINKTGLGLGKAVGPS